MTLFAYKARSTRGDLISGQLEADSPDALATRLFNSGVTPIEISPAQTKANDVGGELWRRLGGGKPSLADMTLFSRQMYAITKAGIPLLRGLKSLAESTPNALLRETLEKVLDSLQAGRDVAGSLARHPDIFSKLYTSIVRVGENSGTLPRAFLRLYEYLIMEQRIVDKMKAATRYPIVVVVAIVAAIFVITFWVLPQFAPIFRALGDDLPFATRILLGVSGFMTHYWYLVIAVGLITTGLVQAYLRSPGGRYQWDRFKFRIPVIGALSQKAVLARVCRSFAVALETGVPMVQGLTIIAYATGNDYMTERVLGLREGIERGESLSHTAATVALFTPLVLQMIAVGEETGALDEMLDEVADFYEREVDNDLNNLSAALEPMLIVGVGVMVLILALGVFLPLWDIAAKAGGLS
jgi:MSHA biogenesis protein MshG